MLSIAEIFSVHHKACDAAFVSAESEGQAGRWPGAAQRFAHFSALLETHFGAEEGQLFPAFERVTGMVGGPPEVMRREHEQIRGLVQEAQTAAAQGDGDAFLGACETLNILMQQHNMKEEHMLYPACDRALGAEAEMVDALRRLLAA